MRSLVQDLQNSVQNNEDSNDGNDIHTDHVVCTFTYSFKFLLHFQNLAHKVSFQNIHLSEQVKCGGSFTLIDAEFAKRNLGKEHSRIHTSFPFSQFRSLGPFL
jgi:hypothetical protein